ncbi:unnamed protein product [Polarella glacialis]|uniref:Uncharacterized protein n=1 Tax=Polarella glacialis TaxID=89957 RepID=A0A813L5Z7_POLGL|nr:unnamed protein product [Polarella glacialis]
MLGAASPPTTPCSTEGCCYCWSSFKLRVRHSCPRMLRRALNWCVHLTANSLTAMICLVPATGTRGFVRVLPGMLRSVLQASAHELESHVSSSFFGNSFGDGSALLADDKGHKSDASADRRFTVTGAGKLIAFGARQKRRWGNLFLAPEWETKEPEPEGAAAATSPGLSFAIGAELTFWISSDARAGGWRPWRGRSAQAVTTGKQKQPGLCNRRP